MKSSKGATIGTLRVTSNVFCLVGLLPHPSHPVGGIKKPAGE